MDDDAVRRVLRELKVEIDTGWERHGGHWVEVRLTLAGEVVSTARTSIPDPD